MRKPVTGSLNETTDVFSARSDIVAEEGETLVFVEVNSRRSEAYGDPQLAVGHEKQKKISRIAMHYLEEKRLRHRPARFDVVAVKLLSRRS